MYARTFSAFLAFRSSYDISRSHLGPATIWYSSYLELLRSDCNSRVWYSAASNTFWIECAIKQSSRFSADRIAFDSLQIDSVSDLITSLLQSWMAFPYEARMPFNIGEYCSFEDNSSKNPQMILRYSLTPADRDNGIWYNVTPFPLRVFSRGENSSFKKWLATSKNNVVIKGLSPPLAYSIILLKYTICVREPYSIECVSTEKHDVEAWKNCIYKSGRFR